MKTNRDTVSHSHHHFEVIFWNMRIKSCLTITKNTLLLEYHGHILNDQNYKSQRRSRLAKIETPTCSPQRGFPDWFFLISLPYRFLYNENGGAT